MKKRQDGNSYMNGYHQSYLFNKNNLKTKGEMNMFGRKTITDIFGDIYKKMDTLGGIISRKEKTRNRYLTTEIQDSINLLDRTIKREYKKRKGVGELNEINKTLTSAYGYIVRIGGQIKQGNFTKEVSLYYTYAMQNLEAVEKELK